MALDSTDALLYRVPPGSADPASTPGPYAVVGHFDDPAASACTARSGDPSIPAPTPAEVVVICRTQFVLD